MEEPLIKSLTHVQSSSATQSILSLEMARASVRRLSRQLACLTSETVAVGEAVDRAQDAIDKKCKEIRALTRRVGARRKELEKLRKRSEKARKLADKAEAKDGKKSELPATPRSGTDGVNTTFATEDMSIVTTTDFSARCVRPALYEIRNIVSPVASPRKRKRFAEFWDENENNKLLQHNTENDEGAAHGDKRARMDSLHTVAEDDAELETIKESKESMGNSTSSPCFAQTPIMLNHAWGTDISF